ncbi:hypothetical protein OLMES_2428 [Oleiphilus messinensis]|uniref:Uncharacterized protein n=1 Tax=Oleiphilus messinensis TaxID=141451 RepID=A0A1Y0I8G2_9GAMM|nr:hypothetical protein [Oleiphilus messinensis]ARU56489.1 hypothetical protein OLMES_2428 [Oleiphilus messinensis]
MKEAYLDAIAGAIIKAATEIKRLDQGESSEAFHERLLEGRKMFRQVWKFRSIDHPDRIALFARNQNGQIQFSLAIIDDAFVNFYRTTNGTVLSSKWYALPVPPGSWRFQVPVRYLRPGQKDATVLPRVSELLPYSYYRGSETSGSVILNTNEYRKELKDMLSDL